MSHFDGYSEYIKTFFDQVIAILIFNTEDNNRYISLHFLQFNEILYKVIIGRFAKIHFFHGISFFF